jgi:hypothetical protein
LQTILAAGSIIQDHNDMDVALVKYRVAAVQVIARAENDPSVQLTSDSQTRPRIRRNFGTTSACVSLANSDALRYVSMSSSEFSLSVVLIRLFAVRRLRA